MQGDYNTSLGTSDIASSTEFQASTILCDCSQPTEDETGRTHLSSSEWSVVAWHISGSSIECEVPVGTITFPEDDCHVVDVLSTLEIFNIIGIATVTSAIQAGIVQSPEDCNNAGTVIVRLNSCVRRTGFGTSTAFSPCGLGICHRTYSFCGNSNSPTIILTSSTPSDCSGLNCSGTCPP